MTSAHFRRQRAYRSLAALALLGAVAAACGSDSTKQSEPSASNGGTTAGTTAGTAAADAKSVHFVNPLPNYPTWKLVGDCMKEEAAARGLDYTESGPTGQALDASAMIQQVQQAIANKRDAIITFPTSDGFTEVLKQAQADGIVTGTIYGSGAADSGSDVNAGPDFGEIGTQLVEAVAALPGDHVLGLVAVADVGLGKAWMDGVKAAVDKTDNVTIAGEVYTGDDAAKALPQVTALLNAHPDVTEIVTHMGTTTPGAVAAIKSLGREGKTFLVAGGHDNGGLEAVEEGTANLMLLQNVCGLGKEVLDGVADVLEGKPAPVIPVRIVVVGKDEIQGYLDQGWE